VNGSIGPAGFFSTATVIFEGNLYYVPNPSSSNPSDPLYVSPVAAPITAGIATIVTRAQQDGLLGATQTFECTHAANAEPLEGTGTTYLQIVVAGTTHNLSGDCMYQVPTPAPGPPTPGTYNAFKDFVTHLRNISTWPGVTLGAPIPWDPNSLAVFTALPADAWWGPAVTTNSPAVWQVGNGTYAGFGALVDPGNSQDRCGILSGIGLTGQLPSIKQAHAGTLFVDHSTPVEKRVLGIHALMPNEPSVGICPTP
jgi:hypothetical protein